MPSFTQLTNNLAIIAALSTLPNQTDGLTAAQLKAKFDEAAGIIKTYLNSTLIAELEASGAADKIGAVVGGASGKIQDFIDAVEAAGTGSLPPSGTVTNTMMATDVKIGSLASLTTTSKASVQGAINELVTKIGTLSSLSTTEKNSLVGAVNEVVSSVSTSNNLIVGKIDYFAMNTAPTGWLKANGAAVSRTTYSALFAAIGTTYGAGNGTTTFNLPDLRGVFPRGWDDGRGYDTGRTFGSYQADDNKAHTHTGTTSSNGAHTHTITYYTSGSGSLGNYGYGTNSQIFNTNSAGDHTHTFTTDSTGSTEVKVKNVALLACIKY